MIINLTFFFFAVDILQLGSTHLGVQGEDLKVECFQEWRIKRNAATVVVIWGIITRRTCAVVEPHYNLQPFVV